MMDLCITCSITWE